jgi:hypothetical protein
MGTSPLDLMNIPHDLMGNSHVSTISPCDQLLAFRFLSQERKARDRFEAPAARDARDDGHNGTNHQGRSYAQVGHGQETLMRFVQFPT